MSVSLAEDGRPTAVLTADRLCVGYGSRTVVRDVSFTVQPGTRTVVVGGNGSGKSTLLRVLAGLAPAKSGAVRVAGRELRSYSPRSRARQLAHLPQTPLVPDGVTVEELILLGRHPHRRLLGGADRADRDAVAWAMAVTGVSEFRRRLVAELSGGERQRAWVAVALAQQAPLLLLDEPTTFLDIRHQLELLELLRDLTRAHGLAVVAVLHELNHAAAFADQLVVLGAGRVLAQGPPAEVLDPALVRAAFGVDVDVEHRGGTLVCHFRALADARPPSPPQGASRRAKVLLPPAARGHRVDGGLWERLRRRDRLGAGDGRGHVDA